MKTPKMNRRDAVKKVAMGASAAMVLPLNVSQQAKLKKSVSPLKGNINHSVCAWCYPDLSLEELCVLANEIGLVGIDLIGPSQLPFRL